MLNLQIKKFEEDLINVINNSKLQPVIVELVIKNLLPEINALSKEAIVNEKALMDKEYNNNEPSNNTKE